MWIITTGGFVSAVEHRDDKTQTMVRARDKKSLEEMLSGIEKGFVDAGKTEEEAAAMVAPWTIYSVIGDYKWRCVVPKSAFATFLVYEAMNYVNYSNFKSKLTSTRGQKWHDAAMKVWSAMFAIEDHNVKTGNPDVDNPKPYSYYHGAGVGGGGTGSAGYQDYYSKYPAPGKSGSVAGVHGNSVASEGTASGSENPGDWMDDAYGAGFYDKSYDTTESNSYRWGGNGLFEEDLTDYEPDARDSSIHYAPSGTGGYHTFSGKDFGIDGRGEIVDGQFIGSSFFEDEEGNSNSDVPTDAELEAVQLAIDSSWEQWDEETQYNTITGETRSAIVDPLFEPDYKFKGSVHSLTDAQWEEVQKQEGYDPATAVTENL